MTVTVTCNWGLPNLSGNVQFSPVPDNTGLPVKARIVGGVLGSVTLPSTDAATNSPASYIAVFSNLTLGSVNADLADVTFPATAGVVNLADLLAPPRPTSGLMAAGIADSSAPGRAALTAASSIGDILARDTPRATPELWSVFANKPGSGAPTNFDTGHTAVLVTSNATTSVAGGLFTAAFTGSGSGASYLAAQLSAPATHIGARFVFSGGSTKNGTAALAICNESVAQGIPDMSCHFTVSPTGWGFSVWEGPNNGDGGIQVLASADFSSILTIDGETEYEAEVWIVGDTATIALPDGTRHTVTDSRIADTSYTGPWVFFEQATNAASTDNQVGFTHLWASSGYSKPSQPTFVGYRNLVVADSPSTTNAPATTATAVPLPGTSIQYFAPPSGTVILTVSVYVIPSSATGLYMGHFWALMGQEASNQQYTQQFDSMSTGQYVTSRFVLSGLTPGEQYFSIPFVFPIAEAATIEIAPDSYYNALVTAEPVY